jgi:serine protease Do
MHGFGEVSERLRRSTVQVSSGRRESFGSGIVWSRDGLILTNAHVARHTQATVQLSDGRILPARVTARDPRRDFAALRTTAASDLEPATPGDSSLVRPGQLAIAVGSPLGFIGAVSTGVIHSIGAITGMGAQSWIRTDVRLAPGNSGGPLADAEGRVIGINTAIVNGIGVAGPVNDAIEFLNHGPRPCIGVTLRPERLGLRIVEVESGSASEAASLRAGDVLLTTFDDLSARLDSERDTLLVRFIRGDSPRVRETVVRLGTPIAA